MSTTAVERSELGGATRPPQRHVSPGRWVRANLFNSVLNSVLTVVFAVGGAYALYRLGRFVFLTGNWAPVRANLELFMIGQFPREERWRIVAQLLLLGAATGLAIGSLRTSARDRAADAGEPWQPAGWRTYLASYWAAVLYVAVLLTAFTRTPGPWLLVAGVVAVAVVARFVALALPRRLRLVGWTLAALLAVVQLQLLTGTFGLAWLFGTVALVPLVQSVVGRLAESARTTATGLAVTGALIGIGVLAIRRDLVGVLFLLVGLYGLVDLRSGDVVDAARVGAVMITGAVVFAVYQAIGLSGIDWSDWGGFHLNLIVTVVAVILAFPFGILLALGRRSTLPALRVLSTLYIEFFRGVPLITILLSAQFFLGFFLDTDSPLSLLTRAIAGITMFTAAYIAEIVRGGLQAVPLGQVEAGQAMGLGPPRIMRLIVLPQALRAVIPAMVGQFISLFKDTTLLLILGSILEYLSVRGIVHAQAEFRSTGIAETLVFVAFGFWAGAFTMSRESQRLERRLARADR